MIVLHDKCLDGLNNVLKFKEKNSKITNNIKKVDKKFKFLINSLSVKIV